MAEPVLPDVLVCVCCHCLPGDGRLARQWTQDGSHICVRELPCSGKVDGQYLLHALEGGGRGVCVVTCPKGECQLAEGNYRAEIRIGMIRQLLAEIGMDPERVELVRCSPEGSFTECERAIRDAVGRICGLGKSTVCVET